MHAFLIIYRYRECWLLWLQQNSMFWYWQTVHNQPLTLNSDHHFLYRWNVPESMLMLVSSMMDVDKPGSPQLTSACRRACKSDFLLIWKKTRINTQISPSLKQPPASGDYYPDPDTVAPAVVVKFACCIVQTSRYGLYRLRSESENLFFFILQHLHYIA